MHIRHCIAAAFGLVIATPAFAEELGVSGTGYGMAETIIHPVAEGHMLMHMNTMYSDFEGDAPDNPMSGMSGPCFGAMEMKDGVISGGGRCLHTDADGDMVTMQYVPEGIGEGGAVMGVWAVSGGTGKWMTASGGGSFSSLTNRETGENVNTVTGSVMMP
jgi:hypothetical protein